MSAPGIPATSLFLLLEGPGFRWAFPSSSILSVKDWEPPLPLPRAAGWLWGWMEHEGRTVPVVAAASLGAAGWVPKLAALIAAPEQVYLLPGEAARFVSAELRPPPGGAPPHIAGSLFCDGCGDVAVADAALLYRAIHLGYNLKSEG